MEPRDDPEEAGGEGARGGGAPGRATATGVLPGLVNVCKSLKSASCIWCSSGLLDYIKKVKSFDKIISIIQKPLVVNANAQIFYKMEG
jgi:hypothetical protein